MDISVGVGEGYASELPAHRSGPQNESQATTATTAAEDHPGLDPGRLGSAPSACLWQIVSLLRDTGLEFEPFISQVLSLLPNALRRPELVCVRIRIDSRSHQTPNYRRGCEVLEIPIQFRGIPAGQIEVGYVEVPPDFGGQVFLTQERALVELVALILGRMVYRQWIEVESRTQQKAAQDADHTLHQMLHHVQEDRDDLVRAVHTNIHNDVIPLLSGLSQQVPPALRGTLEVIQARLRDLDSTFLMDLGHRHHQLTPAELRICQMIRQGLSSKEIAAALDISPVTVSRHRDHIRQKLQLTNHCVNLRGYLRNLPAALIALAASAGIIGFASLLTSSARVIA